MIGKFHGLRGFSGTGAALRAEFSVLVIATALSCSRSLATTSSAETSVGLPDRVAVSMFSASINAFLTLSFPERPRFFAFIVFQ